MKFLLTSTYLDEFGYRFDRRWREGELFGFVLSRAAQADPLPYDRLVAEAAGYARVCFISVLRLSINAAPAPPRPSRQSRRPLVASSGAQLSLFGQLRETREPKGLLGDHAAPGSTHVLNYHRAKGREFDFVVMVVDPRGESKEVALDEMRRLYYVCATRARKGLQVYYYPNELGRVLGPVLRPADVAQG
jgi:hypothetical protein